MSRMVASPSTTGGISVEASMMPNAPTHIQVIAAVTDLKPSLRAVASSTVSSAYSLTNGCPASTPTSAIRNSPALLSGCSQRSSTSVGTVKAATVSSANTARLPISRVCARSLRSRCSSSMSTVMANATPTASLNGAFPTSTQ